jgi:alpha-methylacyl-CoA racemase
MMLADMGADVVCIDRPGPGLFDLSSDFTRRGKRSILLDLKSSGDREILLSLVARADGLFEGFRPGVMERLGLGPEECSEVNPRLVYGRMTGWGQTGPLAQVAGHDINYIALNGVLFANGSAGGSPTPPVPPIGDFGGGAMFLAFGMVCALLEAQKSGQGQVVDAAMTEGSALLMTSLYSLMAQGHWSTERGSNLVDGGAHFYGVFATSDKQYVSIGSLEPQFYQLLLDKIGADKDEFPTQYERQHWPRLKEKMAAIFKSRTREEWCRLLEGTDACFAPVLDMIEAPQHPHNRARKSYVEIGGQLQPAAAPRFSRTPAKEGFAPRLPGSDGEQVLADWGVV